MLQGFIGFNKEVSEGFTGFLRGDVGVFRSSEL